jgi:hypothetical protein
MQAKSERMTKTTSTEKLKKRYRGLAAKLSRTGPILQGTITERTVKGDKNRKQKPEQTYGPYYQWTFKREGKTVTVNLTKKQVEPYQKAIDNNREAEAILKQMKVLSEQIMEAETEGVKRRKSGK